MITVTKKDLIALGYGPSFSADIIKQAKNLMIERGHTYYQSRKLDSTSCIIVQRRNFDGKRSN